jgi:hypothetical protein
LPFWRSSKSEKKINLWIFAFCYYGIAHRNGWAKGRIHPSPWMGKRVPSGG